MSKSTGNVNQLTKSKLSPRNTQSLQLKHPTLSTRPVHTVHSVQFAQPAQPTNVAAKSVSGLLEQPKEPTENEEQQARNEAESAELQKVEESPPVDVVEPVSASVSASVSESVSASVTTLVNEPVNASVSAPVNTPVNAPVAGPVKSEEPLPAYQSKSRSIILSIRDNGYPAQVAPEEEDVHLNVISLEQRRPDLLRPWTFITTRVDPVNFALPLPFPRR